MPLTVHTVDQILALSPDGSSAKAAKGLLMPDRWPTLGNDERAIWGECHGSGSKPYQVIIDVAGPTFKCSCPSRKFPCKHGLALYLLLIQSEGSLPSNQPPTWAAEWLSMRQQKAEKQVEKKEAKAANAPVDTGAAARREARRLDRMVAGARELEQWMEDLVRHGIGDLPTKPASFWRDATARMVDAQASGLGSALKLVESAVSSGEGWPQRALFQLGRIQLLVEAMQRIETLPPALQHDVRISAGWAPDREDVIAAGDRVGDAWHVLGVSHDENERLWERRVWLNGSQSGRSAMLLDYSHGVRHFETAFVPGMKVKATLAFYPGAAPLRALLLDDPVGVAAPAPVGKTNTWDEALDSVAESIARQPWLQRIPVMLHHAIPVLRERRWYVRDAQASEVPMRVGEGDGWQLLALSGGNPLAMFGEWLGDRWRPLSAWHDDDETPVWTEVITAA